MQEKPGSAKQSQFEGYKTIEVHLGVPEELEHIMNQAMAQKDLDDAHSQGFKGVTYKIIKGYTPSQDTHQ